ncbi:DUF547 domain-containing protein/Lzipper-MIP1 domain-containing protein [Cephalotus follicularis]|uniref:DUF547 domain-containing protein/Lzipper-MIP1 domain-containing protein n=1 Tax=Cephalotus follicularis TaxID=3775 RepID=A0A1Q3BK18_CEPFO|nr:DUF547 domain-containing protein/Lzipper-MIP1 domain-containing protein [Cephalotus follicularis]
MRMGFRGSGDGKMLELRVIPIHKRSKSCPDKRRVEEDSVESSHAASHRIKFQDRVHLKDFVKTKKKHSPNVGVQSCLKQEILQLEKRLQDQFEVRCSLEKALGYRTFSHNNMNETFMPKPATELIKEIAVLEVEVVYLEQYLLSLYRKAFDQQISSAPPSTKDKRLKTPLTTPQGRFMDVPRTNITSEKENSAVESDYQSLDNSWKESNGTRGEEKPLDSGVHRCHSSLSQRSAFPTRTSPPVEYLGKAVRGCHSQPLSMMEYAQNATNVISLAEHLGTRISDHVPETPNKLAEDMIKCMTAIYLKLADPPLPHHGLSPPYSSSSSMSAFSPQDQCDMWSPGFRNNSSFDVQLDNPFHVEGLTEFSGPYNAMVEVQWIYRDSQKMGDVEHLIQNFRSLICRLEQINPRKLTHEEKLAFWINIHNALAMHAYLAFGIPRNNVKRLFLLLKAAYNVGGHTISAETIQSSILGCRMSRPGQWLRLFLSSKSRFKSGDERQGYAIEHSEPLLHFALCSGSHSDPAVRVYTPKRVLQELQTAKEEYIRATIGVRKDQKILLPKTVESFTKDTGMCSAGVLEMIQQSLPESVRKSIKKLQLGKSRKIIEWSPHNFTFRYLISRELVR